MYKALYRKWRPRTFDEVVGQEHITTILKNQISQGKSSHAYLFVGTRGTGKTSCAKILSRAINCESPENGNPCNKCKYCEEIEAGSVLDVVELDAASNNGVDNVRELREEAVFLPASVKKRVYIIDEVHMLTREAFNALLKILEEPPAHLMFILATTELHKVPATILSRCQRHFFKRLSASEIAQRLRGIASSECIELDEQAVMLLSRLADGSMRDAVSLLDQCSQESKIGLHSILDSVGLAGSSQMLRMYEHISKGDAHAAALLFGDLWRCGKSAYSLLDELSDLVRDILMIKIAPSGQELTSGAYDIESLIRLGKNIGKNELLRCLKEIQACQIALKDARNQRTAAEICLVRLCAPEASGDISALESRVEKLEVMFNKGSFTQSPQSLQSLQSPQSPSVSAPIPAKGSAESPETDVIISTEDMGKPSVAEHAEKSPDGITSAETMAVYAAEDFSSKLKSALKGTLDIGSLNILCDSLHADLEFEGQSVYIKAKNGFALNYLNRPDIIKSVKEAAATFLGYEPSVAITEAASPNTSRDKSAVDSLLSFGNVIQKK